MKIIIREEQLNRIKGKIIGLINNRGVLKTSELLQLPPMKVMDLIDYDISEIKLDYLFIFLFDMMREYNGFKRYKNSLIDINWWNDDEFDFLWDYNEKIGDYSVYVGSVLIPDFNDGYVYLDNSHFYIESDLEDYQFYNKTDYNINGIKYVIPTNFGSWEEMVEWYNEEFLPITENNMRLQAKEIFKQLKENNEI